MSSTDTDTVMDREPREAETAETDSQETTRKSRRDVLKIGAVLAGATLVPARKARAQRIVRPRPKIFSGFNSNAPNPGAEAITRLVRRATNGITDEDVQRAKQLGFTRYLEEQLNYTRIDDRAVDQYVTSNFPMLAQDHTTLYNADQRIVFDQLTRGTFYRAAYSRRQLYESMV